MPIWSDTHVAQIKRHDSTLFWNGIEQCHFNNIRTGETGSRLQKIQESRAAARKPRDAASVLFC